LVYSSKCSFISSSRSNYYLLYIIYYSISSKESSSSCISYSTILSKWVFYFYKPYFILVLELSSSSFSELKSATLSSSISSTCNLSSSFSSISFYSSLLSSASITLIINYSGYFMSSFIKLVLYKFLTGVDLYSFFIGDITGKSFIFGLEKLLRSFEAPIPLNQYFLSFY
jgi:hypothetical protein